MFQSAERLFKRCLKLRREKLRRTTFCDGHQVFAAQAKFTWNVYAGFVTERHSGHERGFAVAHQIRMIVDVESNPVAQAVSKEFVVRSVAGRGDDTASGVVTDPENLPFRAASSAASCAFRTIS